MQLVAIAGKLGVGNKMAYIKELEKESPSKTIGKQTESKATYQLEKIGNGHILCIRTYGSKNRQVENVVSQNLTFTPDALAQLKKILADI